MKVNFFHRFLCLKSLKVCIFFFITFLEAVSELRKRDRKALEKIEIQTSRTEEEKRPRITTTSHFTNMTSALMLKLNFLNKVNSV